MKVALFNKQSTVSSSPVYIGFLILKYARKCKTEEVSIYKLLNVMKNTDKLSDPKQFMHALFFLHMTGIAEINGSNIKIGKRDAFSQTSIF